MNGRVIDTTPLREFITATTRLLRTSPTEPQALDGVGLLLARLIARDDWLPDELAAPHPQHYCQYLLHADPGGLYSVVSFVWGPGQATPVHDHTVWGLVGVLRGQELSQAYGRDAVGRVVPQGAPVTLHPGQVEAVSPRVGDVHRVSNAYAGGVSVSIHVYGANIGTVQRHVYDDAGNQTPFVSGYTHAALPNLLELP